VVSECVTCCYYSACASDPVVLQIHLRIDESECKLFDAAILLAHPLVHD